MIGTIARKEFVETMRDGRFRLMSGALLVLLLVALVTGLLNVREHRRAVAAAASSESETWLSQGERNPHSAAHFGRYAFKPTPALAYADRGLDPYLGGTVWLEAHAQNPFGLRPAEDRTALQRFGDLSAGFVLQILIPLFVILLSFGAFAGERERGTLRLLLASGARSRDLVLGKSAGFLAALSFVLVPAALLAGGLFGLGFPSGAADPAAVSGSEQMVRFALMAAIYLAYALVFLALALATSALSRSSRTAVTVLLAFWVVSTLIVPRFAADVAERMHPTPSPAAFQEQITEATANGLPGDGNAQERRQQVERETLERYGVATLEELPVDYAAISLQASEEYGNKVFDHFFGQLWQTYESQGRIHRMASVLSPLMAVRSISMGLSGTGLEGHRHFATAAELHRREFVEYLNQDMAENGVGESFGYMADRDTWAAAPAFNYQPPDLPFVLRSNQLSLILLALWLVLAASVAWRFSSRVAVESAP